MPTRDSIAKTARITGEDWKTLTCEMERAGVTFSGLVKEYAEILRRKKSGNKKEGVPEKHGFIPSELAQEKIQELSEKLEKAQGELLSVRSENERLISEIRALEDAQAAALSEKSVEEPPVNPTVVSEIESMARSVNLTADHLISDLAVKLEGGEIGLNASGLTVGVVDECPFDWRQIVSACDEMSLGYDEAVKKCVGWIYKG